MKNYVISDVHGDYEKYKAMLERIAFSDDDTLYVLGDVIDRGKGGIKILQDMMLRPNVIPILGNHEYMAAKVLPWLMTEVTEDSVDDIDEDTMRGLTEWMNVGGEVTIAEFSKLDKEEKLDVLDYLSDFELYGEVETHRQSFVLVHGGLMNFSEERPLWDYDVSELIFKIPDLHRKYFADKYLVFGHVPTRVLYASEEGMLVEELKSAQYRDEIYFKNLLIGIDCGCGYDGKLGCLCLDTLECYYV